MTLFSNTCELNSSYKVSDQILQPAVVMFLCPDLVLLKVEVFREFIFS